MSSDKIPTSVIRLVTLAANDQIVAGPSARRRRIRFFPSGAGYYSVLTAALTSPNMGILVNTNMGPQEFDAERDGSVVREEWHAFPNNAGNTIAVEEVFD